MKSITITTFIISMFLLSNFVYHRIPHYRDVESIYTCNIMRDKYGEIDNHSAFMFNTITEPACDVWPEDNELLKSYYCKIIKIRGEEEKICYSKTKEKYYK